MMTARLRLSFFAPTTALAFAALAGVAPASAQSQGQQYLLALAPSSNYSDQCNGPCACPTILYTMTGKARMTFSHSNPLFDFYDFSAIHWRAHSFVSDRVITGSGVYQIGGEVALTQRLVMDVLINDVPHHLDSGIVSVEGAFPNIAITVEDSPHTSICNYVIINLNFKSLCSIADITGPGGGSDAPDGALTVDDLVAYLAAFFAGNVDVADIAGLGGTADPDNQVTVDDLVAFLSAFFAGGCG